MHGKSRLAALIGSAILSAASAQGQTQSQPQSQSPVQPATLTATSAAPSFDAKSLEFFEKKVRPLLVENCYTCHSANTNAKGGLRVDDRNGLIQGGNSGAAVVPGDPDASLLIQAVLYTDDSLKMPPKTRLSPEQVADLTQWIRDGAAWPPPKEAAELNRKPNAKYEALRQSHWAWQPLNVTTPPQPRDSTWAKTDIDRFILAKLEEKGLVPVGDAEKSVLARRVAFDLTGLPLSPEELDAFLTDESPSAWEKLVDRLLASPAYGERWGRHWLDVARYGESTGSSRNLPYPHAWRYRDYVIDAFAKDKPYDQFVREQIAGDLLPSSSQEQKDEQTIATGFLAVGVKDVNQRFKVRFIMDNVDEQIDAVSRSFLATTASCARCHDHKFDPIPTADYYALAGIFRSTDLCAGLRNKMGGGGLDYYDTQMLIALGSAQAQAPGSASAPAELTAKLEKAKKAVAEAKAEFERIRDSAEADVITADGRPKRAVARQKLNRMQAELAALTDPAANGGKIALGVRDSKTVGDTEIRLRGEAEKLGPIVPRGFLTVLSFPDQPKINPQQSGRLELAQWLTSERNPLTPRVLVNRVWQHLHGEGLVKSVDNFGVTGDAPSHPELLDHLADRFVRDGWSIKKLVRSIVLSRSYQLSSEPLAANIAIDQPNRFLWRHNIRRLEAEEIRDAMLAASGSLKQERPIASAAKDLKVIEMPNNGPLARRLGDEAQASVHRSVYLPLLRGLVPRSLEVFDFAEQGMVTGRRDSTTVATQALYLLNDPFVRRQSLTLAERIARQSSLGDEERAQLAYRLILGRAATATEIERVKAYLADYEAAASEPGALAFASTTAASAAAADAKPATETPVSDAKTAAVAAAGADAKPKRPAPPVNPDEVIQEDAPVKEEIIQPKDSKTAAWMSFCQALWGSAHFRYVR